MKLKTFMATILAVVASNALACGPFWITPQDLVLYKMGEAPVGADNPAVVREQAGWDAWRQLTGAGISVDDICEVLRYDLSHIENPRQNSDNPFERWIAQNSMARDYLSLAKHC